MRLVPRYTLRLLAVALCASTLTHSLSASAQQAPAPAAPYAADPAVAAPVIRPYAWIKPTLIVASGPVESFGQSNSSAITAAGNPVLAAIQDEASLTFQVAQSRLGFWFNEKAPVRGQIEFDFADFAKSSPTAASFPRLRLAKIEWQLTDPLLLIAGQDWDLFQPMNPHCFNITAVAFLSGNTAFVRQQAKFIYHNDSLELGGAVGMAGVNNGAKALVPEYGRIPTLAARAALLFGAAGRVGVSAIGTSWRFAPDTPTERKALAGAVGAYGDVTPFPGFNLRFEAYGGQNLANLGSLSLGLGNATNDLKEIGGWLSAKYSLTEAHALTVLGGTAKVLNDEDVVASYVYPAQMAGAMPPPESAATISPTGPGIASNLTARLGYEYRYDKTIAFVAEGFMFKTKHVLNAEFDADIDADVSAFGAELGLFFTL